MKYCFFSKIVQLHGCIVEFSLQISLACEERRDDAMSMECDEIVTLHDISGSQTLAYVFEIIAYYDKH
jgi:hypothetical protein